MEIKKFPLQCTSEFFFLLCVQINSPHLEIVNEIENDL